VYVDSKPMLINKAGKIIFPPDYQSIQLVNDRLAIVTTSSKKVGLVDIYRNNLLIDTIYFNVSYTEGIAVVTEYNGPRTRGRDRVAIVDTTGKVIVPFGKYLNIEPFNSGFALAEIDVDDEDRTALIDKNGTQLFEKEFDASTGFLEDGFREGFARIALFRDPLSKNLYSDENRYEGFIDHNGNLVFNDSSVTEVADFSGGRSFIKRGKKEYILIDKNFKQVGSNSFSEILNGKFFGNHAIVKVDEKFGIINKKGDFVVTPKEWRIEEEVIFDDMFFFTSKGGLSGIADFKGNIIVEPIFNEIDRRGFDNDIIKGLIDEQIVYVNKSGKVILRSNVEDDEEMKGKVIRELNIDFMNRGYFTAYSSPGVNGDYSNGWAQSPNIPVRATGEEGFMPNTFRVFIDTTAVIPLAAGFGGYRVAVSNMQKDTIKFNAQDSRLYMVMQAMTTDGKWKDIEYTPRSWCGNSYHQIALEPGSYWTFTAAKYSGEIKTKMRIRLLYVDPSNEKISLTAYSNEINGSINPAQFWNKREYYPNGIMDPYNE